MNSKTIFSIRLSYLMKNYGVPGGCYPPRLTASMDNTLLDLHNSSSDTQPHSLTVKYTITYKYGKCTRQLKIKRELKNFRRGNNGGR